MTKLVIALLGFCISTQAFADIKIICNTEKGYTVDQYNKGIPDTILAQLDTSKDLQKNSKLSLHRDKLARVAKVEFNTPDENMVSADYSVNEKGTDVKYEIMFYIGGANSAELYKIDDSGNKIDNTGASYTCGMYDDGRYGGQ